MRKETRMCWGTLLILNDTTSSVIVPGGLKTYSIRMRVDMFLLLINPFRGTRTILPSGLNFPPSLTDRIKLCSSEYFLLVQLLVSSDGSRLFLKPSERWIRLQRGLITVRYEPLLYCALAQDPETFPLKGNFVDYFLMKQS